MPDFISLLGLALLGSVVALIGGVAFLFIKPWSEWLSEYSTPFAAGVLLVVSLIGLLPEAVHEIGEVAFIFTLGSFLTAYLFETFVFGLHHHDHSDHAANFRGSIPLIIVGDTIHNFIDGVAIAAAFFLTPGLGLITAISTLLHEVPHEIGDFGILLRAGWSKKSIIGVNILSALATIVGAFFVLFLTPDGSVIGNFLAIAAGIFLYLGATDFLPHLHHEDKSRIKPVVVLILGVAIMFATLNAIPHSHEGGEGELRDVDRLEQTQAAEKGD